MLKSKKQIQFRGILSVAIFILVLFLGSHGLLISSFIPEKWIIYSSILPSIIAGAYLLFWWFKANERFSKSFFGLLGFYLLLSPLMIGLLWATLSFTVPSIAAKYCEKDICQKELVVAHKRVSCSKKCKYYLVLHGINEPIKKSIKVPKTYYEMTMKGNLLIMEGYQSFFGIQPIKFRRFENALEKFLKNKG